MRFLVRFIGFLFAAGTVVFLVGVAGDRQGIGQPQDVGPEPARGDVRRDSCGDLRRRRAEDLDVDPDAGDGWGAGFLPAHHQGTLFRSGPAPVVNLFDTFCGINDQNFMEYYHDAQISKDAVLNLFSLQRNNSHAKK